MLISGFEITFYSGVYGTSIGQTSQLGRHSIGYVGLTGILIGLGEIMGECSFVGLVCGPLSVTN